MCGIAGRIAADAQGRSDGRWVRAMCERMTHRGPDGSGFWEGGRAALGHLRLSIIDLAGGAQPLAGCTPEVQVTFNGEIYNYLPLKAELEAKGHVFKTRSDTEVLVHGWEEWGERLPEKLRGMFAFAIWDARRQVAFLSRDRLGKKPLYYARAGRDLVFASEVKALFASPGVQRELDRTQLPAYLALRYVPGPATLFKGVQRLQPGHSLRFQNGEVTVWPFWDVPLSQPPEKRVSEGELMERFLHLFEESVRIRLMSDVPVGVFLSGGLDSTAVTWAMRRNVTGPLKSFSVGYLGDPDSELTYAKMAATALQTEHHEVLLTPEAFGEFMPRLAWHLDEPLADAACIPLYYLSEKARQEGVVVVLSGEGADELLAGYPIYAKQLVMEQIHRLPLASQVAGGLSRFVSDAKLRKYLQWVARPFETRYLGVSRAFSDEALLAEMLSKVSGPSGADRLEYLHARTRGLSPLSRMLYSDVKSWLPDDLLIKADKMSMAASIELRTPFLDHELLELCWSVPDHLKLKGWVGKYLLRQGMKSKLPKEILHRPKRGFPVPTGSWLRNQLHAQVRDELLASRSACRSLFPAKTVERLLDEHRAAGNRTEEVFALWCLENWHQRFLTEGTTAEASSKASVAADVFDADSTQSSVPGVGPSTQVSWKQPTPAGTTAEGERPGDIL
ncbi:asparagine synthase (glutamine-hydrolyzing) [Hyalangium sp.]|uniref:asparagine synthase (glutamine-hydrolyzing) n=1 Tax=Hyalangium sp. TaxID=2028555 RepID=UPI002D6051F2|nr:asparagine synthase (glutamine-hydrolyzing) [Hyalangium sp.]HYI03099.1 asparagine synthase (glutamine-hydrolyzing) [Hyalangium sp.]